MLHIGGHQQGIGSLLSPGRFAFGARRTFPGQGRHKSVHRPLFYILLYLVHRREHSRREQENV